MKVIKSLFLLVTFSALLSCAAGSGGGGVQNETGANGLPTPRALYSRYVEAIGGEATIRSFTSSTTRGTFNLESFGISGDATIYAAAPNMARQEISLGGLGEIISNYDGSAGYTIDPQQGRTTLSGDGLADLADQSEFYLPLMLGEVYPEGETVGMETVNGVQAYRVNVSNRHGKAATLFFSSETDLLVRQDVTTSTPIGEVEVSTFMDEYREFEGYTVPVVLAISQAGQEFSIEVDEVTFNDVDPSIFSAR